mgnify:CR=1 FL=1
MKKMDELLNHNYDGIEEYDNALPTWWRALFWLTIVFGIIYVIYFHFGPGRFTSQQLEERLAAVEALRPKQVIAAGETGQKDVEAELLALVKDPAAVAKGKVHYDTKCAACHAALGQGLVGPNLTDDYWIHGSKISDLQKVVVTGVVEKGMIAWGPIMPPQEINEVIAYIWTLHGTNPAGAKEAQGVLAPRN